MNQDDRKFLTEWMGERYSEGLVGLPYTFEGKVTSNRTFTTPDDMMAVKRKLVEKGEWCGFLDYAASAHDHHRDMEHKKDGYYYLDWLLDETRFCQLAVDYLRREG